MYFFNLDVLDRLYRAVYWNPVGKPARVKGLQQQALFAGISYFLTIYLVGYSTVHRERTRVTRYGRGESLNRDRCSKILREGFV